MYCVSCGKETLPGARACPHCGTTIPAPGAAPGSSRMSKGLLLGALAAGCAFVAVPIVGIVAAIAVPNFLNAVQRGKQKRTMADIRSAGVALESYAIDHGRVYPEGSGGLEPLRPLLEPTYVKSLPLLDAWQRPFEYVSDKTTYTLRSHGKDGAADVPPPFGATTSFNADIVFSDGQFVSWPEGTQQ